MWFPRIENDSLFMSSDVSNGWFTIPYDFPRFHMSSLRFQEISYDVPQDFIGFPLVSSVVSLEFRAIRMISIGFLRIILSSHDFPWDFVWFHVICIGGLPGLHAISYSFHVMLSQGCHDIPLDFVRRSLVAIPRADAP